MWIEGVGRETFRLAFRVKLGFANEFRFQIDRAETVDFARDVVTIIAVDNANVFNLGADFHNRRGAFDSQLFDHCDRVSGLQDVAIGISSFSGDLGRGLFRS